MDFTGHFNTVTDPQYTERVVLHIETDEFVPDYTELTFYCNLKLTSKPANTETYIFQDFTEKLLNILQPKLISK